MPYPNFHAARVKDPDGFQNIVVLKTLPDGIMIYGGKLEGEKTTSEQSYRFPKDKYTPEQAKSWLKSHQIKTISFEPASEEKKFADTFQTTKDIFSVGHWEGDDYTEADIDEMIKNFNALKDTVKVPLKVDLFKKGVIEENVRKRHGGMPACGWITDLKKVGQKMYAHIENIPKVIKELIDNKAYRQVSSEITWNFKNGNERLRRVLTGVALLGVEIPGVSNLDEFAKIYNKVDENGEQKFYNYETVKKLSEEEKTMDELLVKQYEAQIAAAAKKVTDADEKIVAMQKSHTELMDITVKERDAAVQKLSDSASSKRTEEIKTFVEKAITDLKVLPAHRELLTTVLTNIDVAKVVKFKLGEKEEDTAITKLFEGFITSLPAIISTEDKSMTEELKTFALKDVNEFGSEASQKLDFLVKQYQALPANKVDGKEVAYGDALRVVSKLHPELVG